MSSKNENIRNTVLVACVAVAVLGTGYWMRHKSQSTADAADAETPEAAEQTMVTVIAPGQLFKASDTFACTSKEALLETVAAAKNRDRAKYAANFKSQTCAHLDASQTYKAVAVDAEAVQFSGSGADAGTNRWILRQAVTNIAQ